MLAYQKLGDSLCYRGQRSSGGGAIERDIGPLLAVDTRHRYTVTNHSNRKPGHDAEYSLRAIRDWRTIPFTRCVGAGER